MGGLYQAFRSLLNRNAPAPVDSPAVAPVPAVAAPAPLPDVTGLPRGTETILFVDYDSSVREPITAFLRQLGYTVLTATDGQDALQIMARQPSPAIDFLLCNMVLPGVSSRQLVSALRQQCPLHRILFYANYPADLAAQNKMLDPAIAYIQKPLVPRRLAIMLRQMLNQARQFETSGH